MKVGEEEEIGFLFFLLLLFLLGYIYIYVEEVQGLEKNARVECVRFFDESRDRG